MSDAELSCRKALPPVWIGARTLVEDALAEGDDPLETLFACVEKELGLPRERQIFCNRDGYPLVSLHELRQSVRDPSGIHLADYAFIWQDEILYCACVECIARLEYELAALRSKLSSCAANVTWPPLAVPSIHAQNRILHAPGGLLPWVSTWRNSPEHNAKKSLDTSSPPQTLAPTDKLSQSAAFASQLRCAAHRMNSSAIYGSSASTHVLPSREFTKALRRAAQNINIGPSVCVDASARSVATSSANFPVTHCPEFTQKLRKAAHRLANVKVASREQVRNTTSSFKKLTQESFDDPFAKLNERPTQHYFRMIPDSGDFFTCHPKLNMAPSKAEQSYNNALQASVTPIPLDVENSSAMSAKTNATAASVSEVAYGVSVIHASIDAVLPRSDQSCTMQATSSPSSCDMGTLLEISQSKDRISTCLDKETSGDAPPESLLVNFGISRGKSRFGGLQEVPEECSLLVVEAGLHGPPKSLHVSADLSRRLSTTQDVREIPGECSFSEYETSVKSSTKSLPVTIDLTKNLSPSTSSDDCVPDGDGQLAARVHARQENDEYRAELQNSTISSALYCCCDDVDQQDSEDAFLVDTGKVPFSDMYQDQGDWTRSRGDTGCSEIWEGRSSIRLSELDLHLQTIERLQDDERLGSRDVGESFAVTPMDFRIDDDNASLEFEISPETLLTRSELDDAAGYTNQSAHSCQSFRFTDCESIAASLNGGYDVSTTTSSSHMYENALDDIVEQFKKLLDKPGPLQKSTNEGLMKFNEFVKASTWDSVLTTFAADDVCRSSAMVEEKEELADEVNASVLSESASEAGNEIEFPKDQLESSNAVVVGEKQAIEPGSEPFIEIEQPPVLSTSYASRQNAFSNNPTSLGPRRTVGFADEHECIEQTPSVASSCSLAIGHVHSQVSQASDTDAVQSLSSEKNEQSMCQDWRAEFTRLCSSSDVESVSEVNASLPAILQSAWSKVLNRAMSVDVVDEAAHLNAQTDMSNCCQYSEAIALEALSHDFDLRQLSRIKLLAADLDKTLCPRTIATGNPETQEDSNKNIEAFLHFTRDGGLAIPVTEHSPAIAQKNLDRYRVPWKVQDNPGVFFNGALVLGINGAVEYSAPISARVMETLQDWAISGDGHFDFEGNVYPFAVICLTKSNVLYFSPSEVNSESRHIAENWANMQLMNMEVAELGFDWETNPAYQVNLLLDSRCELLKKYPCLQEDAANKIHQIQMALLCSFESLNGSLLASGCEGKHVVTSWCKTSIVVSGVHKAQSLNRFIHAKSVKEHVGAVNVGTDVAVIGNSSSDLPLFAEWPQVDDFYGEILQKTVRPQIRVVMPNAEDEQLLQEANIRHEVHEVLAAIPKARLERTPDAETEKMFKELLIRDKVHEFMSEIPQARTNHPVTYMEDAETDQSQLFEVARNSATSIDRVGVATFLEASRDRFPRESLVDITVRDKYQESGSRSLGSESVEVQTEPSVDAEKTTAHGSRKPQKTIYDACRLALQNFGALEDLFNEMGLVKGTDLSYADFELAMERLGYPIEFQKIYQMEPVPLLTRYLRQVLTPFFLAWQRSVKPGHENTYVAPSNAVEKQASPKRPPMSPNFSRKGQGARQARESQIEAVAHSKDLAASRKTTLGLDDLKASTDIQAMMDSVATRWVDEAVRSIDAAHDRSDRNMIGPGDQDAADAAHYYVQKARKDTWDQCSSQYDLLEEVEHDKASIIADIFLHSLDKYKKRFTAQFRIRQSCSELSEAEASVPDLDCCEGPLVRDMNETHCSEDFTIAEEKRRVPFFEDGTLEGAVEPNGFQIIPVRKISSREWRVFGISVEKLFKESLQWLDSEHPIDELLKFPKRLNGTSLLMRENIMRDLLLETRTLKSMPASDVSAAQGDVNHLSLRQLLRLRNIYTDFKPRGQALQTHAALLDKIHGRLLQEFGNIAMESSPVDPSIARTIGLRLILIRAVAAVLPDPIWWVCWIGNQRVYFNREELICNTKFPAGGSVFEIIESSIESCVDWQIKLVNDESELRVGHTESMVPASLQHGITSGAITNQLQNLKKTGRALTLGD